MNDNLENIIPLDPCRKEKFLDPAHRIIKVRKLQHRSYHEHPIQGDLFPEDDAIAAWSTVTCSYSGIEQAMKCLLQMRCAYVDRLLSGGGHRHHHIAKLFKELTSEEKEVLRFSYAIYRSLHNYIPPETADCFLNAIDEGYPTWRYFLLEGRTKNGCPTTHPGAMLEIWHALTDIIQARVFRNHGLHTVKRRIENYLEGKTIHDAWLKHIKTGLGNPEIKDMNHWIQGYNNITINAYAHLLYCEANRKLDLIQVLPSTRQVLRTLVTIVKQRNNDNDFSCFLHRAQKSRIDWNPRKNRFETGSN